MKFTITVRVWSLAKCLVRNDGMFSNTKYFFSSESLLGWPEFIQALAFSQRLRQRCFLTFQCWWGAVFSCFFFIMKNMQELVHVLDESTCFTFFTCFKLSNQSNLILVLTMLVCQYKIVIKDEPQFAGETFEERKWRILSTRAGLTL